jgi:anti-anti-sigma factor
MSCEINIQKDIHPGVAFIGLGGHIGIEEAVDVSKALEDVIVEGFYWVILSLREVDFLCTAGIGAMLYAVGGARRAGGDIIFIDFSDNIQALFEFLDLNDYIATAAGMVGALKVIQRPPPEKPKD